MDNLEPEAEITRQIYDEYRKGNLSEDGFTRLIDKQTIASQSAVLIADELGKTLIASYIAATSRWRTLASISTRRSRTCCAGRPSRATTSCCSTASPPSASACPSATRAAA